ncbi:zinc finger protein 43 [Clonorchis sinensis]|uniref:Zinc finger protein 43 n=1 Tax=Clonorchis sinensis TaxID=79923 RepID=G7YDU6_CLOSI|nr:zinc finger protein 43 [Clonorchis sinensis]
MSSRNVTKDFQVNCEARRISQRSTDQQRMYIILAEIYFWRRRDARLVRPKANAAFPDEGAFPELFRDDSVIYSKFFIRDVIYESPSVEMCRRTADLLNQLLDNYAPVVDRELSYRIHYRMAFLHTYSNVSEGLSCKTVVMSNAVVDPGPSKSPTYQERYDECENRPKGFWGKVPKRRRIVGSSRTIASKTVITLSMQLTATGLERVGPTVNKLPTSEYGNFGQATGLQHVKLIRNNLPTTEETDDKSRVYKCHLCGNSFAWSWKLRSHTLTHSGSRNYPCDLCDKLFQYEHTMNAHIRTVHMDEHSGDQLQKHTCEVCGKRCTYQSDLEKHRRVHSKVKPFRCNLCGIPFSQSSSLRRHRRLFHAADNV